MRMQLAFLLLRLALHPDVREGDFLNLVRSIV